MNKNKKKTKETIQILNKQFIFAIILIAITYIMLQMGLKLISILEHNLTTLIVFGSLYSIIMLTPFYIYLKIIGIEK